MKNTILITRIVRAVETSGAVGDGAGLAQQYAEAVNALNARLEATQTALDAGQTSEAVRLMEEEPKLVDEIGALDFHQLAPWRALCTAQGWPTPPAIDQSLVDRILEIYNGSTMLEPALKAYRKAMRTRDERQIASSLRRLAELEPANAEWRRDLTRAETAVQKTLATDFRAASTDQQREEIAADLLDTAWAAPPEAAVLAEASAWRSRREADRRAREQSEDLDILRKCVSDIWSRSQAESLITHLDALAEQGTPLPPTEVAFVDSLRTRCAEEAKAEANAARWTELMAALHAAVEHDSPDEIRRVMAEPEFLDRPPDEDLLRAARRVIRNAEEQRRRKTRLVVAAAVVVLAAVGAGTAKLYADKMFRAECDAQVAELEQLATAPLAHETLAKALDKLAEEKPKVYADPAVSAYREKLDAIRQQRAARLALARDAIETLEKERNGGWNGDEVLLDEAFQKARANVKRDEGSDDVELAKHLDAVQLDFEKVKGERRATHLALAEKEAQPLLDQAKTLQERLSTSFLDDFLQKSLSDFREKADLWKSHHAEVAAEQTAKLDAALDALVEPEKRSGEAEAALERLRSAANADDLLAARDALVTHYGAFQNVSALVPLPFGKSEIKALLAGTLPAQRRFADTGHRIMAHEEFSKFLEEDVLWLDSEKSFTSVFGLSNGVQFEGFAIGKAGMDRKESSTKTTLTFRGDILNARDNSRTEELNYSPKVPRGVSNPQMLLLPCSEIRDILDKAHTPGIDAASFASMLWNLVQRHVTESHKVVTVEQPKGIITAGGPGPRDIFYKEFESRENNPLGPGRFPAYKRVQSLSMYFGWLEGMNALPSSGTGSVVSRCRELAAPVSVDGVEDSMTWLCLLEPRVQRRNAECAAFLASIPRTFVQECRASMSGTAQLDTITGWRAEFAGHLRFDPVRADKCIPATLPGVKADHPLYVLRKGKNGSSVLRKLLIDGKAKDTWMIAPGRGGEWLPGEPLFQVRDASGALIDASVAIANFLKTLPTSVVDDFKSQPFWIELGP